MRETLPLLTTCCASGEIFLDLHNATAATRWIGHSAALWEHNDTLTNFQAAAHHIASFAHLRSAQLFVAAAVRAFPHDYELSHRLVRMQLQQRLISQANQTLQRLGRACDGLPAQRVIAAELSEALRQQTERNTTARRQIDQLERAAGSAEAAGDVQALTTVYVQIGRLYEHDLGSVDESIVFYRYGAAWGAGNRSLCAAMASGAHVLWRERIWRRWHHWHEHRPNLATTERP